MRTVAAQPPVAVESPFSRSKGTRHVSAKRPAESAVAVRIRQVDVAEHVAFPGVEIHHERQGDAHGASEVSIQDLLRDLTLNDHDAAGSDGQLTGIDHVAANNFA